jgi:hypothetical protein
MHDPRLDKLVPLFLEEIARLMNAKGMMKYARALRIEVNEIMNPEKPLKINEHNQIVEVKETPEVRLGEIGIDLKNYDLESLNKKELWGLATRLKVKFKKTHGEKTLRKLIAQHTK